VSADKLGPLDETAAGAKRPNRRRAPAGRRLRSKLLRPVALGGVLLPILMALVPAGTAHAEAGGLHTLGLLTSPTRLAPDPVAVDAASRRMYAVSVAESKIVEFDLTPRIPTVRRVAALPFLTLSAGKPFWALDAPRHRLYYLDIGNPPDCPVCQYLRVVDLQTLTVTTSHNLSLSFPHFVPEGLTYSTKDRLIYLTASVPGDAIHGALGGSYAAYYPLAIAAFDPDAGAAVWWKLIPQCLHPMSTFPIGGIIARSQYQDALYTGCVRADNPLTQVNYPGESGLVRLWFTPRADLVEASSFPIDYFPISGTYTLGVEVTGVADFDPVAERFYMVSRSDLTPGAWVFDGRNSAWVGFVPAQGPPASLGVDPGSGHVFMQAGSVKPELIVADGRATPAAQGNAFSIPISTLRAVLLADPLTGRVFVPTADKENHARTLVAVDATPRSLPAPLDDPDALTTDVPEGSTTEATYFGSLNGYGSRVVLVGGTGGITTSPGYTLNANTIGASTVGQEGPDVWDRGYILGLSPGDRGLFFGHVASVDVRGSGAGASAQAITGDSTTAGDFINQQNRLNETLGQEQEAEPWPWPAATCLDGGGKATSPDTSGTGTVSKASCNLKEQKGGAYSAAGNFVVSDGISLGPSSFEGSAVRTAADGIVTIATAVARDIRITVPGAGSLTIARIKAVARTVAHGRRGTAAVRWTRDIEHVGIVDASGKPVFSCATQCDTSVIEEAVHTWAGMKLAIKFPTPQKRATPGGAFAGIQKTVGAYYDGFVANNDNTFSTPAAEIVAYNDYGERSRVLIQLAAIQASSTYTISVIPPDEIVPPSELIPPVPPVVQQLPPFTQPPAQPPAADNGSLIERVVRSARFLVRSPGDAFLVALTTTLALAAVGACIRRRSLLGVLDDFGAAQQSGGPGSS
jgi:hypothetical protein